MSHISVKVTTGKKVIFENNKKSNNDNDNLSFIINSLTKIQEESILEIQKFIKDDDQNENLEEEDEDNEKRKKKSGLNNFKKRKLN
jgi:hypothetical protein